MTKPIQEWTKKELEALPLREWNEDIGLFNSLIILPTKHIHDSGYACMDFVAVVKGEPTYRLSGCSDVLHINGISGRGEFAINGYSSINGLPWSIDCLPKSRLLQIFCDSYDLKVSAALSSFEVFAKKQKSK